MGAPKEAVEKNIGCDHRNPTTNNKSVSERDDPWAPQKNQLRKTSDAITGINQKTKTNIS